MKVLIGLIVLVTLGLLGAYYLGGVAELDPREQAIELRGAIREGMGWRAVIEQHEPGKYAAIPSATYDRQAPEVEFKPEVFEDLFAQGEFPSGFAFKYRFTEAEAFEVIVDAQGTVVEVRDLVSPTQMREGEFPDDSPR